MKGSTIVLATDLSDSSAEAARWAHAAGAHHQLPVTVVHVISISAANWATGAYDVLEEPELMANLRADLKKWYREKTGGEASDTQVLVGHIPIQLQTKLPELNAAMLVMATSDKSRWRKFLLGSTAQAMAQKPPCPVILVRPDDAEHTTTMPGAGEIAVGVDFSPTSARALAFSAAQSRATNSKLHLVHVGRSPMFMSGLEHLPDDLITTDYQEWAEAAMEEFVEKNAGALKDTDFQAHVLKDYPSQGLIEFTRQNPVELLVVGRAGHSALFSDSVGDVLLKVLQSIPTTTCVVPIAQG